MKTAKQNLIEYKKRYYQEHKKQWREYKKKWYKNHPEQKKRDDKLYNERHKDELRIKKREYRKKNRERIRNYMKNYQEKHRLELHERRIKYYQEHKEEAKLKNRAYVKANKEHVKKYMRQYLETHRERINEMTNKRNKNYNRAFRRKALEVVGKNILACSNCGCTDIRILEIDHINGGGRQETKGRGNYTQFIRAIARGKRKTDDLRILCKVCNAAYYVKQKFDIDFEVKPRG